MTVGKVFIATSLDGYIARSNGDIDWLTEGGPSDEDFGYNDFMKGIDGIVMGRGTFEKVLEFDEWPYSKPVVVLSHHLNERDLPAHLQGKARFSSESPTVLLTSLSHEGWGAAYIDGGHVIQSFIREKLISEMVITRLPVLIGSGRPLFGDVSKDVRLEHVETHSYSNGFVQSHYKCL